MIMDLSALRIFKAIAEEGSVTRAAARLHRVQSNVSARLAQLEETLGVPLFHRAGRRLLITTEGERLLTYADRLLQLSDEAQAAVRGYSVETDKAGQSVIKLADDNAKRHTAHGRKGLAT